VTAKRSSDGKLGFDVQVHKGDVTPRVVLESTGPTYVSEEQLEHGDPVLCINGVNVVLEPQSKVGSGEAGSRASSGFSLPPVRQRVREANASDACVFSLGRCGTS
jgi:hypothetical protein